SPGMDGAYILPGTGGGDKPNGGMLATAHVPQPSRSCSYLMISRARGPRNAAASTVVADAELDASSVRVLLVIEMSLLRGALAAVLDSEEDIEVVGGIAGGDKVVPTAMRYQPDIAVLDVEAGGSEALTTAQMLRERLPGCRVVVLASAQRPGLVRRALDIPVAGAGEKDAPPQRPLATIPQVPPGQR